MKINQVAAQLWTLRDHLKTPVDVAASLKKVRAMGYEAVQDSGMGPIEEAELVKILKGEGLVLCATHEASNDILDNTAKVIEHLQKLGCKHTAYPYPAGIDFSKQDDVDGLVRKLDAAGEKMSQAGQVLSYHNHAHEFYRFQGKPLLEYIYAKTNPRFLLAELDTYWVQAGGGDPVAWCKKMAGRMPLLHLKDYGVGPDGKSRLASYHFDGRGVGHGMVHRGAGRLPGRSLREPCAELSLHQSEFGEQVGFRRHCLQQALPYL